jgi:hypothetical protein
MKRALLVACALVWAGLGIWYAAYSAHKGMQYHHYYDLDAEGWMIDWTLSVRVMRVAAAIGCLLALGLAAASPWQTGRSRAATATGQVAVVVGLGLSAAMVYAPTAVVHDWHSGADTLGALQLCCALGCAQALLALIAAWFATTRVSALSFSRGAAPVTG